MRKLLMNSCLTIFALLAPLAAAAGDCGSVTKIMRIEPYGYVPDIHYICSGQSVAIYNQTGQYVTFYYTDAYGRTTKQTDLRHGSWIWISSSVSIYNSTYTRDRQTYRLANASVRSGTAPDSY
ncbi:hypothetical protein [Loktanella salsilacus]|uniref:Membrane-bound lysozyme-inhibitor of c-type lysozyme n=1 Tax=Loktanella salsilacus TaxID=195913 RepID=A0A1I4C130_9RHOB|nr:hypothetical protein [Loktanella salsilacus]SFK74645.1 hypothetical protein SAMN04488004_101296 [Loktanella salsilacus]